MSVNSSASTGPTQLGTTMNDTSAVLYAAFGILMASARRKSATYFLNRRMPAAASDLRPNLVPNDKYPTLTCDNFMAGGNSGQLQKPGEPIGRLGLALDCRFADDDQGNARCDTPGAEPATAFTQRDGNGLSDQLIRNDMLTSRVPPAEGVPGNLDW